MEIKNKIISTYIHDNNLKLEDLINDYSNYVYTIIRKSSINLSDEDTDEIVSDVFFTIWRNIEKLDYSKNISPYISGITKNLIKKKVRKTKINSNIDDYDEMLVDLSSIELCCIENEKRRIITNEIKKLKKYDKEIFLKYYYEDTSIKDIAEIYNISQSKVKVKLFRIRKKIKKILKERGYDLDEE